MRQLLGSRMLLGVYVAQYCITTITYFFLTWFPVYLVEGRGMSILKVGFVASLPALFGFVGGILGGVFSDALIRRGLSLTVARKTPIVAGNPEAFEVVGASRDTGAFLPPILLLNEQPLRQTRTHETECFGPVSTLMPYKTLEEAIEITQLGKGSLVSTICTFDRSIQREYVLNAAAFYIAGNVIDQDKFARELIPSITKAIADNAQ